MGESTLGRRVPVSDAGKWRKPSRCQGGECAEVRRCGDVVMMRNSTRPEKVIAVGKAFWHPFIAAAKAGAYDLPD
jgi:hypothetical protein